MKIGVISDIHGNGDALNKVILDMRLEGVDEVVFLGDLVLKGADPKYVLDKLIELRPVIWIVGNTDLWLISKRYTGKGLSKRGEEIKSYRDYGKKYLSEDDIKIITNKPKNAEMVINGIRILCVHGSPRSLVEGMDSRTKEDKFRKILHNVQADIILCGHTHMSTIRKIDDKIVFNVGSVGASYDNDNRASYGIININNGEYSLNTKRVNYDISKEIDKARVNKLPYSSLYENLLSEGLKGEKSLE